MKTKPISAVLVSGVLSLDGVLSVRLGFAFVLCQQYNFGLVYKDVTLYYAISAISRTTLASPNTVLWEDWSELHRYAMQTKWRSVNFNTFIDAYSAN